MKTNLIKKTVISEMLHMQRITKNLCAHKTHTKRILTDVRYAHH